MHKARISFSARNKIRFDPNTRDSYLRVGIENGNKLNMIETKS